MGSGRGLLACFDRVYRERERKQFLDGLGLLYDWKYPTVLIPFRDDRPRVQET